MILRVLVLAVIVGGGYLAIGVAERRTRRSKVDLARGVTVVIGPTCRLCLPAVAALQARDVETHLIDVSAAPPSLGTIRSLPLAVLVDRHGQVVMRRSGRSVLADADRIAEAAARVGVNPRHPT